MPVIVIALLLLLLVIAGPWLGIWAINTLFGTAIIYGVEEWAAIVVLMILFGGSRFSTR